MKKLSKKFVKKKTLISLLIATFLLLCLISILIYQYCIGFSSKTLSESKKAKDETISSEEEIDDEDSTTEENDQISEHINDETEPEEVNNSSTTSSSTPTTTTSSNWWEYPDEILETTKNGDDLLVLVTKKYKLPSTYIPSGLVNASGSGIRKGSSYLLRSIIISDLKRLVDDISAQGIDISMVSGYRSYSTQVSTYQYWVSYNGGVVSAADKISARAGHSQHQLGTVVDFSTSEIGDGIGSQFAGTKAQIWLANNAHKYGFALSYPSGGESVTGYSYESWHYRYIGVSNATNWKSSGLILDQWLSTK